MINDHGISKTKVLLILLVVLVFLLGLFAGSRIFYHEETYPSSESSSSVTSVTTSSETLSGEDIDPAAVYLVNLSEEQISKIELFNSEGYMYFEAELDKVDGAKLKNAAETVYALEEPDWEIINQAEVQTLVQSLFTIRYKKALSNEQAAEADFSENLVKVIYTLAAGETIELQLGASLKNGDAFARISGDEKTYLVSGVKERLERGPLSLISDNITTIDNKSIKNFNFKRRSDRSEMAFSLISKATLPAVKPNLSPTILPSPSPTVTPGPMNLLDRKWELLTPLHWDAKSSEINSLVSELSVIYPQEFVEYGDFELKKYGFDKPAYTITLQSEYEEIVLEIGSVVSTGRRYARITKYPVVFILNMSQLSIVDRNLLDLISPYFASLNINSVTELLLEMPDGEIHAEIMVPTKDELLQNTDLKESFYVNGMDANITSATQIHYFKQFYRSLIALQLDGIDTSAPADYAAEFKIMYTLKSEMAEIPTKAVLHKDGRLTISLDFVSRDLQTYYVYLNGQASGFYMNKSQLDTNRNGLDGFSKTWSGLSEAMYGQEDGKYDLPEAEE